LKNYDNNSTNPEEITKIWRRRNHLPLVVIRSEPHCFRLRSSHSQRGGFDSGFNEVTVPPNSVSLKLWGLRDSFFRLPLWHIARNI